jgi:Phytanoyl-CoA dioxygenase (PhyH)
MIMAKLLSSFLFAAALSVVGAENAGYVTKTETAGFDRVKEHFETQGYVLLRNFFKDDKPVLKNLRNSSKHMFHGIFQEMFDKGLTKFPEHSRVHYEVDADGVNQRKREYSMPEGRENGFQEIVMRTPGRYEISLVRYEWDGPKVNLDPVVQQLKGVISVLFGQDPQSGAKLNMETSFIVSTAEAEEQPWHADGKHVDFSKHLPVHCLNVFIPLVNVPTERGPTELSPGSHYFTRQPSPMKIDLDKLRPLAPEMKLGDILIFDYRLLHRGKPNLSKTHRPMLVLTFSEPTFKDVYNWPKRSLQD